MYKKALVLFRKDFRLFDHSALQKACSIAHEVVLGFCFDPRQTDTTNNPYFSSNAFEFLIQSLEDLSLQAQDSGARLHFWHGNVEDVLAHLLEEKQIDCLCINADYTPFSRMRDNKIHTIMKQYNGGFFALHDCLLTPPGSILSGSGTPYKVFTPFWKNAKTKAVSQPSDIPKNIVWGTIDSPDHQTDLSALSSRIVSNPHLSVHGGRKNALQQLNNAVLNLAEYKTMRDFPSKKYTTQLSAYIKFGCVSIREVFWTFAIKYDLDHDILRELYWRDFYYHVAHQWPEVFGLEFQEKYRDVVWKHNEDAFSRWCEGQTGFPIVDAGMRQLNTTGFMHNRVRMIVASFLVKDLHIDWRWGEKYFAQKLVDYDPCVNNGSWQWAASTGCDAQPYFRIFNPWRQQERFDPECEYIKHWIPELASFTPKEIHQLEKKRPLLLSLYPEPMVEHKRASALAKMMFQG